MSMTRRQTLILVRESIRARRAQTDANIHRAQRRANLNAARQAHASGLRVGMRVVCRFGDRTWTDKIRAFHAPVYATEYRDGIPVAFREGEPAVILTVSSWLPLGEVARA